MSLLTAVNEAADAVDLDPFTQIVGGDSNAQTMLALANLAGDEIASRVDWQALLLQANIVAEPYVLPEDFGRMIPNAGIVTALGVVVRPVTNIGQWNVLQQIGPNQPYYYRSEGTIKVLPTTAADGAVLNYVSSHWVLDENGEDFRNEFGADSDTTVFPERLITLNLIWRWKRAKGLDFTDQLAEFEAALQLDIKADRGIS